MRLRAYHPDDLDALYDICLKTGDSGQDATQLYRDSKLLGHRYAAPYAVREPDLTFVLEDEAGVCGYVLGAADSAAFYAWFAQVWTPPLRERYPYPEGEADSLSPDERLIRLLYETPKPRAGLESYPAHLHIDLLPRAQGQGWGRRLMEAFLAALRERGVKGVHLGAGSANTRALGFYEKLGFAVLERSEYGVTFGLKL